FSGRGSIVVGSPGDNTCKWELYSAGNGEHFYFIRITYINNKSVFWYLIDFGNGGDRVIGSWRLFESLGALRWPVFANLLYNLGIANEWNVLPYAFQGCEIPNLAN